MLKVVPCCLLTVLSGLLVKAMKEAAARKRKLCAKRSLVAVEGGVANASGGGGSNSTGGAASDRTTAMLVAIVACFVVTELPQGVLALLGGLNHRFFELYYVPLGDFMDILVLVNSSANFILYCSMSRLFRITFARVFFVWRKDRGGARAGGGPCRGGGARDRVGGPASKRNGASDPLVTKATKL